MTQNNDNPEKQKQDKETSESRFRPTPDQLKALAAGSAQFLATAKNEELGEFVEDEESPSDPKETVCNL